MALHTRKTDNIVKVVLDEAIPNCKALTGNDLVCATQTPNVSAAVTAIVDSARDVYWPR